MADETYAVCSSFQRLAGVFGDSPARLSKVGASIVVGGSSTGVVESSVGGSSMIVVGSSGVRSSIGVAGFSAVGSSIVVGGTSTGIVGSSAVGFSMVVVGSSGVGLSIGVAGSSVLGSSMVVGGSSAGVGGPSVVGSSFTGSNVPEPSFPSMKSAVSHGDPGCPRPDVPSVPITSGSFMMVVGSSAGSCITGSL